MSSSSASIPENRYERTETDRFKCFSYDELLKRDKVSLDIFWLKDESLEDSANLPDPDVLALEIAGFLASWNGCIALCYQPLTEMGPMQGVTPRFVYLAWTQTVSLLYLH